MKRWRDRYIIIRIPFTRMGFTIHWTFEAFFWREPKQPRVIHPFENEIEF